MQHEQAMIGHLAEHYATRAMVFKSDTGTTIASTLAPDDGEHVVAMSVHLKNGFHRLVERDGLGLGEFVRVDDQEAVAALRSTGMIRPKRWWRN